RGHFSRVYRDYNDYDADGTRVWRFETADGSQHYFGTDSALNGTQFVTVDGSYVRLEKLPDFNNDGTYDGWIAEIPDGTRLILDHRVGNPDDSKDIRPDKGWYVTRMEGPEKQASPVTSCTNSPNVLHYDCTRTYSVAVAYSGSGSAANAACMSSIVDTLNRTT